MHLVTIKQIYTKHKYNFKYTQRWYIHKIQMVNKQINKKYPLLMFLFHISILAYSLLLFCRRQRSNEEFLVG